MRKTLIRVSETGWFLCCLTVITSGDWAYFALCKYKYQSLGIYGNELWCLMVEIILEVGEKFSITIT
jgi:hypothetical protein